jgi:ribosomal protein L6P/L9E
MSRIGRKPIAVPKGVKLKIEDGTVEVTGPKGTLSVPLPDGIKSRVDGEELIIETHIGRSCCSARARSRPCSECGYRGN